MRRVDFENIYLRVIGTLISLAIVWLYKVTDSRYLNRMTPVACISTRDAESLKSTFHVRVWGWDSDIWLGSIRHGCSYIKWPQRLKTRQGNEFLHLRFTTLKTKETKNNFEKENARQFHNNKCKTLNEMIVKVYDVCKTIDLKQ